jgi:protein-tyrosine phosphatase
MSALDRAYTIVEVEPNLFVSAWQAATDQDSLQECGARVVVNVHTAKKPPTVLSMYDDLKIQSYDIHMDEVNDEKIQRWFPRFFGILDFYLSQEIPVLVHCSDGGSRSIAMVASYMLIRTYLSGKVPEKGKPIVDAIIKYIITLRKHVSLLPAFKTVLRQFENDIRSGNFNLKALRKTTRNLSEAVKEEDEEEEAKPKKSKDKKPKKKKVEMENDSDTEEKEKPKKSKKKVEVDDSDTEEKDKKSKKKAVEENDSDTEEKDKKSKKKAVEENDSDTEGKSKKVENDSDTEDKPKNDSDAEDKPPKKGKKKSKKKE